MRIKKHSLFFLGLFYSVASFAGHTWYGKDIAKLAMIKEPVVDLFINLPMQNKTPASPGGLVAAGACRRAHQGLFNEVVTCMQVSGDHVQVSFDNILYGHDELTKEPLRTFWISRDKLLLLPEMEDLAFIPAPLAFTDSEPTSSTLVLILPWRHYSLATRFVRAPERDTATSYGVKFFDAKTGGVQYDLVPKKRSRLEMTVSRPQARANFVTIVNKLVDYTQRSGKVIPYVWGGSSCTQLYDDSFKLSKKGNWTRPDQHKRSGPYNGYDCSELVLRLAQVSGVPYFYKTSKMLADFGQELTPQDKLESGDLFWIPGHVMIISNLAKNELIEARGYGSGYGKVQRIALKDYFSNIKNFAQLRAAHLNKEPLVRLKGDGTVEGVVKEFKLIKLV
jgi:hypothetical protein